MSELLPEWKTDWLLLLIGENNLPNAIAATTLASVNTNIRLLHTTATEQRASTLLQWLKEKQSHSKTQLASIDLVPVSDSEVGALLSQMSNAIPAKAQSVGLNYTGGTKAMAVHGYRAVQEWSEARRRDHNPATVVLSYIDALERRMYLERTADGKVWSQCYQPLGTLSLPLDDLLRLHGWTGKIGNETAVLPNTRAQLLEMCSQHETLKAFEEWIFKTVRPLEVNAEFIQLSENKSLEPFNAAIKDELNDTVATRQPVFEGSSKKLLKWLKGDWLEHEVLDVIQQIRTEQGLHDCAQDVTVSFPGSRSGSADIQVDVVCMRGYQLFVFSCTTDRGSKSVPEGEKSSEPLDGENALLKKKLFEALVRARQLGGDDARVAFVCLHELPELIEREIQRDFAVDRRVKVFGRTHLKTLKKSISDWMSSDQEGG